MNTKRIIPCLDVKDGRVVKGINFLELCDAGDPVKQAQYYDAQGADEIIYLDITASHEKRDTMIDVVRRTASAIMTPITVGGGVRTVNDAKALLENGADKVAINTAAIDRPELISELAEKFGSQAVCVAVDARQEKMYWRVFTVGGRKASRWTVNDWVIEAEHRGAGEILLTSMDRDGTRKGYDIALTQMVSRAVNIPVIASGGCGSMAHMAHALLEGKADAVLAASIFHYRETTIQETKQYLEKRNINVRIES
ncbi:imidazole glycerol phosphate synthase subunit HisF [bacterium]|nr:imidazole glycerol phosphate synthase subunit HisF [bacterium]